MGRAVGTTATWTASALIRASPRVATGARTPMNRQKRISARQAAERPAVGIRGDDRNRTGVAGFADPCLNHSATSPRRNKNGAQEPRYGRLLWSG
jgi:hypothetical protein